MTKVINIISDHNIGGAGKCVLIFSENYDREKFDLTVIVPTGSLLIPELIQRNVKYICCDGISDTSLSVSGVLKLRKIIKKINPSVVHTHGCMSGRIAAKLCNVKKIIYTLHCVYEPSSFMKSFIGKAMNKIVSWLFSTDIIAVAEAAKDNLIKVGINPDKVSVVLNGITPLNELSQKEKDIQKKRFSVSDGQKVISIVARLENVKGHKYFIEAAKILQNKNINAKFIIAGNGSAENEIKEYAEKTGADILFTGFISDAYNLLSVTDISVNASFGTEATSISLLEGMSLGIPAVVSNYGGNPGVIKDGQNGFLFPVHKSDILAEKLEILINDTNLYKKMSDNALKIFRETFTAKRYTNNIEEIYMRGDLNE